MLDAAPVHRPDAQPDHESQVAPMPPRNLVEGDPNESVIRAATVGDGYCGVSGAFIAHDFVGLRDKNAHGSAFLFTDGSVPKDKGIFTF